MTQIADDTTLILKRAFNAPVAQLYQAWVSADQFCKWMGPSDEMTCKVVCFDVEPGGAYAFTMTAPDGNMHGASGVFRHVDENARLAFTWTWDHVPERETFVTVEFRGDHLTSSLTLTHERHTNAEARENHGRGWGGSFDRLQRLLETSDF